MKKIAERRWLIPFALTGALLFVYGTPRICAQGNIYEGPIGVTGIFNGNVATGCSYDPLTHSAHREVTDIMVPGSIGKYPLKMTRYYNSRQQYYALNAIGLGPGWAHEYSWLLWAGGHKVVSPHGNVYDDTCGPPVGVSEDWEGPSGGTWRLGDGGRVHFNSGQVDYIEDPYGLRTTIEYQNGLRWRVTEPGGRCLVFSYNTTDPSDNTHLLTKVEAYDYYNGHRIDWVSYSYTSTPSGGSNPPKMMLTGVTYSDGTSATYSYTADNVTPANLKFYPLLQRCDDVRYNGPMRTIYYDYQNGGPHGAIIDEKYPGVGAVSAITGGPDTFTETRGDGPTRSFTYTHINHCQGNECDPCSDYENNTPPQQMLDHYTDFKGNITQLGYDNKWYVYSVTDANIHTTYYTRGNTVNSIGEITQIKHPDTTTINYGYYTNGNTYDPHYLVSIIDERGNKMIHTRDPNTHKILQTDYIDVNNNNTLLARETFTYCDQADAQCGPASSTGQMHGQIKRHRLKNGAYVHYRYDSQGRGLLVDKWEPTWNATAVDSDPKTHYDYYTTDYSYTATEDNGLVYPWMDRVKTVTLPANVSGNTAYDTYEYDRVLDGPPPNGTTNLNRAARPGRGLVTKITHADAKYQQFKYDAYGNKRWEDNELRNASTYTYDAYNRLLSVTRPLSEITTYTYNPTNGPGSSYTHTTNSPDTVTVRTSNTTNIITTNVYDENVRKTSSTVEASTTWFHYDPVGNQDYITDPRGSSSGDSAYTTYTDYDSRNRKWRVREPLSRTTQFYYDDGVNLTRIIRPDQTTETKAYDGLNRLKSDTVPQDTGISIVTQFQYNPWSGDPTDGGHSGSLLQKVIDGESHNCQFKYDAAGLKTQMTYHDASSQSWAYDDAHNLKSRTTVAGEIQNFGYDNRNRKTLEWWNGWPADGEWRAFGYDGASHLTLATNGLGTYWTNFIADVRRSYDDAGRLTMDRQKVYVNGVPITKDVDYPTYTDDGRVTRMFVNGASPAYDYTFSYDAMGRFEKIFGTGQPNPFFQYHYDLASNENQRDSLFNGVLQIYPRDELNRVTKVELQGASSAAREVYAYYTIGRLHTVTREDNQQDQFVYYLDGELKQATYAVSATPSPTATPPPSGTPAPPVATAATNVTSAGFSANWRTVGGANGYRLDVSTSSTFANYVPGYQNLNVGNVTSRAVSGLAGSTTYYYRMRAYNGNGTSGNSNVISVTTTAAGQVATPTFNPDGADYVACYNSYTFNVMISTTTSGAQIRWTIDGSTPSPTNGNLINPNNPVASFTVGSNQTKTLKAMAYKTGMANSNIKSADFTFERECGGGPGYPLDNAGLPPAGPVAPDLSGTFTYTLNKAGNRTAVNGVNYSPNSINQYTSVGGTAMTNGPDHEIQVHYGFTYHYMRDQELEQITATGFTYDFAFDALGRCVKRTVNNAITTYYIYDGEKPILEYNANNALVGFNLYGKGVDEIIERGAYGADNQWHWYFLNQDHEGSVTHLTDADGTIIEKYRYDAFGTPSFYNGGGTPISTTAYNNRFLFTGREYLGAWIYDYRARLYHAYLGRFMSEDPKLFDAGDYNLFRYCHNDPLDLTDPMGLWDMGDVKEAAYSLWYAGPRATFDAQSVIGNTSGKFAVEQGRQATIDYKNDNAGEAVRHEVWQAELARKYGEKAAKAVGDAHEKYKSRDASDSKRDQYHNELGRENSKTSQGREDSVRKAREDWETARAARDKFDLRLNKSSDTQSDTRTQKPPDASSIEQKAIQQGAEKAAEKVSNAEHGLNPKPQ